MNTMPVCKECGATLTAAAPQGLCPKCLMKVAMGSEAGNPAAAGERKPAPPPADIAKHFPHLEILELLGQGGMGAVYKARHRNLDRMVALKILPPHSATDAGFAERFNREARALAKLGHPNIVAVYDFGQADGLHYLTMEYVDGLNLRQLEQAGKLPPREALQIIPQICEALQFAHDEGIVHRDIKPENVLLDKRGRVKIADFGLARILGREPESYRLTGAKDFMGTPHYMAPEQIEHPQAVDHRADIYSLGVVFYEMLTGELPLGRFAPPSQRVQVDVRLDEVVLKSLEKEPGRRYQHASEIKTDVETIAGIMQRLPPHLRSMYSGYEYRSKKTLWGLPLVHVAFGMDVKTGKPRVARGIIAIGNIAKGAIAIGGMAFGGLTFGGLSIGLLAVGGGALGLIAVGGGAIALLFAFGGGALAPVAIGGGAVGVFAIGGGAFGLHAIGGNAQDEMARSFFAAWEGNWLHWTMIALFGVAMLFPLVMALLMWRRQTNSALVGTEEEHRRMRWTLLGTGVFTTVMWFVMVVQMFPVLRDNPWKHLLKPEATAQSSDISALTTPQAGELEFRLVATEEDTRTPADELADPYDRSGQTKLRVLKEVLLDSSAVASARLATSQTDHKEISVVLKDDAAKKFADITAVNLGRRLAIVWRGRVLSAPVIRTTISGPELTMTGIMSDAESVVLLDLLNYKSGKATAAPSSAR